MLNRSRFISSGGHRRVVRRRIIRQRIYRSLNAYNGSLIPVREFFQVALRYGSTGKAYGILEHRSDLKLFPRIRHGGPTALDIRLSR